MTIDQGSDFSQALHFKKSGLPIDMSYHTISSQMRLSHSSNDYVDFTVTTNGDNHTISLTNSQTKNLTSGSYVYDVELATNFTFKRGYFDTNTNSIVLYSGGDLADIFVTILQASVGFVTIPSDRINIFDFNGDDDLLSHTDAIAVQSYAFSIGGAFAIEFADRLELLSDASLINQTLINKLLTGSARAIVSTDNKVNRVIQGNVTVTREVSR
jgi:hypothetical protein